ncbi:MAG: 50S ribosomal protein L32e [Candidatus Bathyarchaeota archaeon]|nr:50S ribosomal protein L32e [Candidatus Bathyarchaeota archaeon]MDH5532722.1 50S ribosomal protein L32e [Candidatus Bathyarchaeota archaeon]MDH5712711.1 50S ribosomal protein L32e [Candidatus Bathyarchaeota archaeon]
MKKGEEPGKSARQRALAVRKRVKSRKPDFKRQESWRYKRVEKSWRKPRGLDSKMRKRVKGWPRSVAVGYRGPKDARGLHPSGYVEILVRTVDDVSGVDSETQAVRVGHTVGARKRVEILARAEELGVRVLNPKAVEVAEEEVGEEEEEAEGAEGGEEES